MFYNNIIPKQATKEELAKLKKNSSYWYNFRNTYNHIGINIHEKYRE